MTKQQAKRRRKRYRSGSAYAVDVKPTGFLGLLGSARTMRLVFILMAAALVAGGFGAVFGIGFGGSNSGGLPDPVLPDDNADNSGTPEAQATIEVRQYPAAPAMSIDASKTYLATIKTPLGDIEVELLASEAPQTVNNFVFLARDGFYNGLAFYRVDPGFAAQAGDPACTPGSTFCHGDGDAGYDLPSESPGPFEPGVLGMANASQFFIALTGSDQFEQFTPFGRIISGLNIAQQLTEDTEIESIEIQEQ